MAEHTLSSPQACNLDALHNEFSGAFNSLKLRVLGEMEAMMPGILTMSRDDIRANINGSSWSPSQKYLANYYLLTALLGGVGETNG